MKKLLLTFSLVALLLSLKAQTKVYYSDLYAKMSASGATAVSVEGSTDASSLITPGDLKRGSGFGSSGLQYGFSAANTIYTVSNPSYASDTTGAVANNQYFEFSFTVGAITSTNELNLTGISAILRRSGAGNKNYFWKYAINSGGFNYIDGSLKTDFDPTANTAGLDQGVISLLGISALQNLSSGTLVTFRLYGYGATTVGGSFAIGKATSSLYALTVFGSGSALPVSLTSFTAKANKQGAVNLAWSTASEQDNSHFEVTRSVNGVDFEKIAEVKGNGNSDVVSKYSYTDTKPVAGTNYYRLKQIDFNGDFAYSAITTAKVGLGSDNLTVAVAANKSAVTVNYKASVGGKAHFGIYNSTGVKLASVEQTVTAGLNQISIPANLGNSIHILNVSQAGATASIKF